jgi:hypothetical protein
MKGQPEGCLRSEGLSRSRPFWFSCHSSLVKVRHPRGTAAPGAQTPMVGPVPFGCQTPGRPAGQPKPPATRRRGRPFYDQGPPRSNAWTVRYGQHAWAEPLARNGHVVHEPTEERPGSVVPPSVASPRGPQDGGAPEQSRSFVGSVTG